VRREAPWWPRLTPRGRLPYRPETARQRCVLRRKRPTRPPPGHLFVVNRFVWWARRFCAQSTCRFTGGSPCTARANGSDARKNRGAFGCLRIQLGGPTPGDRVSPPASLSGEADENHLTPFSPAPPGGLDGPFPTGTNGAPDTVGPACDQPEVPRDAAPLTSSTNSAFDGRCAANFRGSLWSRSSLFATQKTLSDAIFLSTACSELLASLFAAPPRGLRSDREFSMFSAVSARGTPARAAP
jgi:hypothetical protein